MASLRYTVLGLDFSLSRHHSFPLLSVGMIWVEDSVAEVNSGFHFGTMFESPTGQIISKGGHLRIADDVDLDPSLGCPVFSSPKVKQRSRSVLFYRFFQPLI